VIPEALKRAFFRSFFRLLILVIAAGEWVCVAWLFHAAGRPLPAVAHLLGVTAIFVLNRWIVAHRRGLRAMPRPLARLVPFYAAAAFTSVFCALFLAAAGVLWAAAYLLGAPVGPGEALATPAFWLVNLGVGIVAGLFVFGYTAGQRALVISRLRVPVPGLPPALDGFRIVHLSDIHIGAYLGLEELARHVERVNALEPDLLCVTGDLVDRVETCDQGFPVLAALRARHGVMVTLGNHDFYAGADDVTEALRRHTPFTVLRDAAAEVQIDGCRLAILGIDDLGRDWARGVLEHPALHHLTRAVPPDVPVIVLSHRPDCFLQAVRLGATLMLSGHTHGGQLALPTWNGGRARNLAEFISPFSRGLYRAGASTLYVNQGIGFTAQKIRLFTPREIACLELVPARGV
jgi:predicted MPP superfamily phosphohydrolase